MRPSNPGSQRLLHPDSCSCRACLPAALQGGQMELWGFPPRIPEQPVWREPGLCLRGGDHVYLPPCVLGNNRSCLLKSSGFGSS